MPDLAVHELTPDECRVLLAPGGLGRVAVSVGALPAIHPVPFALVDHDVVVRASTGGTLARAMLGSVVAFEVDGSERAIWSSWSVHVIGFADVIDDAWVTGEAVVHGLDDWLPAHPFLHVRIPTTYISGRVVGRVGTEIGPRLAFALGRTSPTVNPSLGSQP